jgi:hypothetical protein
VLARPDTIIFFILQKKVYVFLTFYADLIKWIDGLTGWPDTVSKPRVQRRYADLIKLIDGLTGWPDTVSRPA